MFIIIYNFIKKQQEWRYLKKKEEKLAFIFDVIVVVVVMFLINTNKNLRFWNKRKKQNIGKKIT